MAFIYKSREEASKAAQADLGNSVIVTIQQRNPVRYPSILVPATPWHAVDECPMQYREIVRGALHSGAESILATHLKDNPNSTVIDDSLIDSDAILAAASGISAGASLSKTEFIAAFNQSILGIRMGQVAKTKPALAKRLQDHVSQLHSAKACKLGDSELVELLTILTKPDYAGDSESQWYLQALRTIETVQGKRTSTAITEVF